MALCYAINSLAEVMLDSEGSLTNKQIHISYRILSITEAGF